MIFSVEESKARQELFDVSNPTSQVICIFLCFLKNKKVNQNKIVLTL